MGVNPILSQSREWLIQPEALRSMAIAARSFDSGTINLAANKPSSPLLTIDKGIGVIAIEGPLARSLAPAVVSGNFQHLWLYPAATVLGAQLAVPLCKLVRGRLDA